MGELTPWPGGGGGGGAVASVFGRKGAVAAQAGDYTAAQVGAPSVAQLNEGIEAAEKLAVAGDLAGNLPNPTIRAALKALIEGALQPGAAAAGDLAGTYPNPTIGALKVTGAKIAVATVSDAKLEKPVIVGAVKATGEKESGSGFTCSKIGTGSYKIELETELPTTGIMVVTSHVGASGALDLVSGSKKVFEVVTFKAGGTEAADSAFNFIVKAS